MDRRTIIASIIMMLILFTLILVAYLYVKSKIA